MGLGHDEFWTGLQPGLIMNMIARYMEDEIGTKQVQMLMAQYIGLAMGIRPANNAPSDVQIPEGW